MSQTSVLAYPLYIKMLKSNDECATKDGLFLVYVFIMFSIKLLDRCKWRDQSVSVPSNVP